MLEQADAGAAPGEDAGLPTRRSISAAELERVIHRAAELQFARESVPDVIDEAEVLHIAEEVGLEGRHIRQALAEVRAEAMVPTRPGERSVAARLWGEAAVVESRVVPGSPPEVLGKLRGWLPERESLHCVRDRPGHQVWEPASDLVSQLQRGFNFSGRGYQLAKARTLKIYAQPLEEGRTLVSAVADVSNTRNGAAAAWYGGLGTFGLGTALGAVLGEGASAMIVLPAVTAGVAAVGTLGTAKTLAHRRNRVRLAVQGLLDRLETDSGFASDRLTLKERIGSILD